MSQDTIEIEGPQQQRVYKAMKNGRWWTLAKLRERTGDPVQSISARIRDFRKPRFGMVVETKKRNDGNYAYRLVR